LSESSSAGRRTDSDDEENREGIDGEEEENTRSARRCMKSSLLQECEHDKCMRCAKEKAVKGRRTSDTLHEM
jgi:hypothetical protein